ncbi:MAG: hypothetical protein ACT4OG_09400 [Alphaproteobacteria bacterium]
MNVLKLFSNTVFVVVLSAATMGCSQYYEWRIDRLYVQCSQPDLVPTAMDDCLRRITQLETAYPSPRLASLRQQLEMYASGQGQRVLASTDPAGPGPEGTPAVPDGTALPDEYSGYPGYSEPPLGPGYSGSPDQGGDYDELPFEPESESIPPSEPQEPLDPNR